MAYDRVKPTYLVNVDLNSMAVCLNRSDCEGSLVIVVINDKKEEIKVRNLAANKGS